MNELTASYNASYNNSGHLSEFIIYIAFSHVYFWCHKFSFQTYMVQKSGAGKWSLFIASVPGAYVVGIVHHCKHFQIDITSNRAKPLYVNQKNKFVERNMLLL